MKKVIIPVILMLLFSFNLAANNNVEEKERVSILLDYNNRGEGIIESLKEKIREAETIRKGDVPFIERVKELTQALIDGSSNDKANLDIEKGIVTIKSEDWDVIGSEFKMILVEAAALQLYNFGKVENLVVIDPITKKQLATLEDEEMIITSYRKNMK